MERDRKSFGGEGRVDTWARDDGMPEPRAMNIAVATTSYPLWTLDQETVTRLCREGEHDGKPGIVAPTGKPGSVLMFHGNLVHASAPNITPYPRRSSI
jgi:L-proline 4-hydroxylase